MLPTIPQAQQALTDAHSRNPGPWADHSRYVAAACQLIAAECPGLDPEKAYILGLLHDIGRYAGVTGERHLLDGYRYCMDRSWEEAARVCITHAFMIQDIRSSIGVFDVTEEEKAFMAQFLQNVHYDDYDRLVQLCDALALPTGFCLLEKRFVDVALRYGTCPYTVPRWKATLEIKAHFEAIIGFSIYDLLPGIAENTFL